MQKGSYTVRKTKKNSLGIIYVQGTVDEKQYRLSTGKEANPINIKWIKRNYRDVLLKLVDKEKPKIKLSDFKAFALDVIESGSSKRDINTQRDYESVMRKHILPYFQNYTFSDFKPLDIEKWQNILLQKLSPSRAKLCRMTLKMILTKAVANDIITKNPFDFVDVIKVPCNPREPYTQEEMHKIISASEGWFKVFITIAFGTGARTGEIMALRWNEVDFENNTINIKRRIKRGVLKETTKTKVSRKIEMLQPVKDILKWYYENRESDEWLFISKRSKEPFKDSRTIVDNHFKPLLKRLNIRYRTLYSTRHTFMTLMVNGDVNLKWIQETSGIKTTSVLLKNYTHFKPLNSEKLKIANNLIA